MPIPKNYHDFPAPSGTLANLNRVSPGAVEPSRLARMWRPLAGALMEGVLSTLSRFSLRLIDRTDGNAYSADELEAKVIGQTTKRSAGTPVYGIKATGIFTADTIEDGDELAIDGVTYHFTSSISSTPYYVDMGASDSAALDNLVAAITAGAGEGTAYGEGTLAHPSVTAAAGAGDTVVITSLLAGLNGNSITTTAQGSAGSFAAATLSGGVDAFPASVSSGDQLFDANFLYTASVAMDETAVTGWLKSAVAPL